MSLLVRTKFFSLLIQSLSCRSLTSVNSKVPLPGLEKGLVVDDLSVEFRLFIGQNDYQLETL